MVREVVHAPLPRLVPDANATEQFRAALVGRQAFPPSQSLVPAQRDLFIGLG